MCIPYYSRYTSRIYFINTKYIIHINVDVYKISGLINNFYFPSVNTNAQYSISGITFVKIRSNLRRIYICTDI